MGAAVGGNGEEWESKFLHVGDLAELEAFESMIGDQDSEYSFQLERCGQDNLIKMLDSVIALRESEARSKEEKVKGNE